MGEGEGKKDVTDQIEDEEQLLGLKGDEPDKEKAEEPKELGTFAFHRKEEIVLLKSVALAKCRQRLASRTGRICVVVLRMR